MRILGLDLGTKTLGVSVSDVTEVIATSITTLRFDENDYDSVIEPLKKIIDEYSVTLIILGYPKNMNNTEGDRVEATKEFKDMLERRTGLPVTLKVRSSEMLEAMIEPAMMIVDSVHSVLEKTPPELAADISDRGIYMTGGGCLVDGLDKLLQEKTGINVMIAQDSVSCVALGTGKALDNLDVLEGKVKK